MSRPPAPKKVIQTPAVADGKDVALPTILMVNFPGFPDRVKGGDPFPPTRFGYKLLYLNSPVTGDPPAAVKEKETMREIVAFACDPANQVCAVMTSLGFFNYTTATTNAYRNCAGVTFAANLKRGGFAGPIALLNSEPVRDPHFDAAAKDVIGLYDINNLALMRPPNSPLAEISAFGAVKKEMAKAAAQMGA